jgi:hypothetical protein
MDLRDLYLMLFISIFVIFVQEFIFEFKIQRVNGSTNHCLIIGLVDSFKVSEKLGRNVNVKRKYCDNESRAEMIFSFSSFLFRRRDNLG